METDNEYPWWAMWHPYVATRISSRITLYHFLCPRKPLNVRLQRTAVRMGPENIIKNAR